MVALVHLLVWRQLSSLGPAGHPVRPELRDLTILCTIVLPQRRPTRRGNVWCFGLRPDVIQDVPDVGAVGDKADDAHLASADRA